MGGLDNTFFSPNQPPASAQTMPSAMPASQIIGVSFHSNSKT
jgi:hypothetical protein